MSPQPPLELPYFDPTDTAPRFLVNRDREQAWLRSRLVDYLKRTEETTYTGRPLAVIGEKGVGKTILGAAVLQSLKQEAGIGDRTLFLRVDCRRARTGREVLTEVAQQMVEALALERTLSPKSSVAALLDAARILRTLCNFDGDAELKTVHEHLQQYKTALNLKGEHKLLGSLAVDFGISLERTEKQVKTLEGKLRFDDKRLARAMVALLTDIRSQGLHIVLHIDNIDELRHEGYQDTTIRTQTRHDVESILALIAAPIALLLCMRTYFAGSLPREVKQTLKLEQLASEHLQVLLWPRLTEVPAEQTALRQALSSSALQADVDRMAAMSRTPLSFLTWLQARMDEPKASLEASLRGYLRTHYASLPESTLEAVARVFAKPEQPVPSAQLHTACGGNQAVYNQLLDRQVVLPLDYWHPTEFTLDPELDFLFWLLKGREALVSART